MIPVTQTKVVIHNKEGQEVVRGNCFPAVVASILEVPISEVPNVEVFYHMEGETYWAEVMQTFLTSKGWEWSADNRYSVFHSGFDDSFSEEEKEKFKAKLKDTYYLGIGDSPRGIRHVCIYQNGLLAHDPHPSRDGLATLDRFESIEKT